MEANRFHQRSSLLATQPIPFIYTIKRYTSSIEPGDKLCIFCLFSIFAFFTFFMNAALLAMDTQILVRKEVYRHLTSHTLP